MPDAINARHGCTNGIDQETAPDQNSLKENATMSKYLALSDVCFWPIADVWFRPKADLKIINVGSL